MVFQVNAPPSRDVLIVSRAVAPGAQLTSDDLSVVTLRGDPAVEYMAASRRDEVTERVARVQLFPGMLLVPSVLGDRQDAPAGQAIVAVLVPPGRAPRVQVGDRVLVVFEGVAQALDEGQSSEGGIPATIHGVDVPTRDGDQVIYLAVDPTLAPLVSVAASTLPISLVLLPAG